MRGRASGMTEHVEGRGAAAALQIACADHHAARGDALCITPAKDANLSVIHNTACAAAGLNITGHCVIVGPATAHAQAHDERAQLHQLATCTAIAQRTVGLAYTTPPRCSEHVHIARTPPTKRQRPFTL